MADLEMQSLHHIKSYISSVNSPCIPGGQSEPCKSVASLMMGMGSWPRCQLPSFLHSVDWGKSRSPVGGRALAS